MIGTPQLTAPLAQPRASRACACSWCGARGRLWLAVCMGPRALHQPARHTADAACRRSDWRDVEASELESLGSADADTLLRALHLHIVLRLAMPEHGTPSPSSYSTGAAISLPPTISPPSAHHTSLSQVSATSYTVIGVVNKLLTVLGSALVTDRSASTCGIGCLIGCLVTATLYRQAPLLASRRLSSAEKLN